MTAKKYIKIPEPIVPIKGAPFYTFKECVTFVVDNESRFQSPASHARIGMRILDALDAAIEEVVELGEQDHKFLNEILEKPDCGYGAWYLTDKETKKSEPVKVPTRTYMPYINAVDQATNSDPRTKSA